MWLFSKWPDNTVAQMINLFFFIFTQCHCILAVLHKTASANHDKNQKREMRKPQSILSRVRMHLQRRHTGDLSCSVSDYNVITFSFYYCNSFLAFSYVLMTLIYVLFFCFFKIIWKSLLEKFLFILICRYMTALHLFLFSLLGTRSREKFKEFMIHVQCVEGVAIQ